MGRDQTRVLICAAAALALVIAGALIMDWYYLTLDGVVVPRIALDLRSVHACNADHVCVSRSLTPLPGMFPTLAVVTLWSSLGFAALIVFQAGARLLIGSAYDSFTRLGYMLSLMAISLAVATAYLFGPEPDGVTRAIANQVGFSLHRTWGPLTLIAGLCIGFAAIYLAVAGDSSDLGATYQPVIAPARALDGRPRLPSAPLPPIMPEHPAVIRASRASTDPSMTTSQPGIGPAAPQQLKTGTLPPMPEHLRNRLHYVAVTAELTGGGIDARREDGLSRLVLWRDVVGVVARRMPPTYDSAAFIDIVSMAGSTLRIVPWTRLTGELIAAEGDDRARAVVDHVIRRCPGAKLDPATRLFLETGELAQLPDLATLRAHDDRLA